MSTPSTAEEVDALNKELIENAARSVHYKVHWKPGKTDPYVTCNRHHIDSLNSTWNPIRSDSDAQRLAVHHGMLFKYMHEPFELFQKFYLEELDKDKPPASACRYAITRVAAHIGSKLPTIE